MDEVQEVPSPETKQSKLSKEERSKIAADAAKRRWAKAKRATTKNAKAKKAAKGKNPKPKKGPREFSSALKVAEKRLSKAIQEKAEAGAKYAILSAEIPSLQRIIAALRNPNPTGIGYETAFIAPSLEQIVGDQPLQYQNPPRAVASPTTPAPPMQHPANTQGRAMGGAIGLELAEDEDEDVHLRESGVAGGNWH